VLKSFWLAKVIDCPDGMLCTIKPDGVGSEKLESFKSARFTASPLTANGMSFSEITF